MIPLTARDDLHACMAALYPRTHGPLCPDRYRAIAEWWRLHAEECVEPSECFQYAAAQEVLALEMEARGETDIAPSKDAVEAMDRGSPVEVAGVVLPIPEGPKYPARPAPPQPKVTPLPLFEGRDG